MAGDAKRGEGSKGLCTALGEPSLPALRVEPCVVPSGAEWHNGGTKAFGSAAMSTLLGVLGGSGVAVQPMINGSLEGHTAVKADRQLFVKGNAIVGSVPRGKGLLTLATLATLAGYPFFPRIRARKKELLIRHFLFLCQRLHHRLRTGFLLLF